MEDGTVVDSNVGSVTSSTTERNTEKHSETVTEKATQKPTEKITEKVTEAATILPGTAPLPQVTDRVETSAVTTEPGTASRFGGFARGGKG